MADKPKAVAKNVTLYPEHDATVEAVMNDRHLYNYSEALRQIIHEWNAQHSIALPACDGTTENDGSHE